MNWRLSLVLALMFCEAMVVSAAESSLPPRAEILEQLRHEHPRLLARRTDFEQLAAACKENERAGWGGILQR